MRGTLASWARSCIRDGYWLPRALLAAVMAGFLVRYLSAADYSPPFHAVNLVVHEAGHALFSWSGSRWWTVAGGTLLELAVPPLAAVLFARQRDPMGVAVAVFWLGTALVDVSIYVADARAQLLPLVSMWEGPPIHDWSYLLGRGGNLPLDEPLGRLFRGLGLLCMAWGVAMGAWFAREVYRRGTGTRKTPADP